MTTIRFRRGTTAEWATAAPVLASGEPGIDLDTGSVRVGDSVRAWASLARIGSAAPSPEDQGLIGWTVDPAGATSTVALTLGQVFWARVPVRWRRTATRLRCVVTGAGATPTAGQCWMGIASPAGAVLATGELSGIGTGEQSATWTGVTVEPPYVYAGILVNAAGAPTLLRGSFVNAGTNWGTSPGFRGALGATAQTTIAGFDPASLSAGSVLVMGLD